MKPAATEVESCRSGSLSFARKFYIPRSAGVAARHALYVRTANQEGIPNFGAHSLHFCSWLFLWTPHKFCFGFVSGGWQLSSLLVLPPAAGNQCWFGTPPEGAGVLINRVSGSLSELGT